MRDEDKINKYYKDFDFDEVRRNMEIEFYFEGIRELKNKIDCKNNEYDESYYVKKLKPFLIDLFKVQEIKEEPKLYIIESQVGKLFLPKLI